jgi:hypothetical protein
VGEVVGCRALSSDVRRAKTIVFMAFREKGLEHVYSITGFSAAAVLDTQ